MRADFALDYDVLSLEQDQKLYLMARFVSGPATYDRPRRPLNLSLVIDRSGSMAGKKLSYTQQSSQFLVQNLSINDIFSIVLYNDKVETLLMPEKVQRKDAINQKIEQIKAQGTTNLSSGWLQGCTLVAQNLDDGFVNRVILMSDGLANRGVTSSPELTALAKQKYEEGISTTTMGLGNDFNEDLMMDIANAGGGAFYFIESPESAPIIFKEELQGLLNVVGQNLSISIEPASHVTEIRQLNAYPMQIHGKTMVYRLGDVFGDEVKALVLELSIPKLKEIGEKQIATLKFEYDEIQENGTKHDVIEYPVVINVKPKGSAPELINPEVQQTVLLLKAAHARQEAVEAADKGDFDTAATKLRDVANEIAETGTENPQLQEEKEALLEQAENIKKRYDAYSRKSMTSQSFYSMSSRHEETIALRFREHQKRETQAMPKVPDKKSSKIKKLSGTPPTHATWKDNTYKLDKDLIRMGRATQNEIHIDAKGVSRFHCQIKRDDNNQLILEDLGSTNGTTIEGKMLLEPHQLSVGDIVYLCDEKFIFHDGTLESP